MELDIWKVGIVVYFVLLVVSFFPVAKALVSKIPLNPGGASFNQSIYFDKEIKELLNQHYSRIEGTLFYWKKQASIYKSFHYYSLLWTIPSAVLIPALTPWILSDDFSNLR
jgi:hypothetical protein